MGLLLGSITPSFEYRPGPRNSFCYIWHLDRYRHRTCLLSRATSDAKMSLGHVSPNIVVMLDPRAKMISANAWESNRRNHNGGRVAATSPSVNAASKRKITIELVPSMMCREKRLHEVFFINSLFSVKHYRTP